MTLPVKSKRLTPATALEEKSYSRKHLCEPVAEDFMRTKLKHSAIPYWHLLIVYSQQWYVPIDCPFSVTLDGCPQTLNSLVTQMVVKPICNADSVDPQVGKILEKQWRHDFQYFAWRIPVTQIFGRLHHGVPKIGTRLNWLSVTRPNFKPFWQWVTSCWSRVSLISWSLTLVTKVIFVSADIFRLSIRQEH